MTTSIDPIPHGDHCPGTSVAGAIEVATHGNWDGGSFTNTIGGETHNFSRSDYWAEWLDNKYGGGICNDMLSAGDDVLLFVDFSPPPSFSPTIFPLHVEGVPATVEQGAAFTATVVEYRTDGTPGTGSRTPVGGVTIAGGGTSAVTGFDGRATLAMPTTGSYTLQATKPRERSTLYSVCVHRGDDGLCGSGVPGSQGARGGPDTTGPTARIAGLRSGKRFSRRRAPRLLRGTVDADPSGLRAVYLRLWRHYRGRCYFYSGASESLRRAPCGSHRELVFAGERASWSYLLPFRLPAGHYRLDAVAADRLGNGSPIVPGRNRVDFYVR